MGPAASEGHEAYGISVVLIALVASLGETGVFGVTENYYKNIEFPSLLSSIRSFLLFSICPLRSDPHQR